MSLVFILIVRRPELHRSFKMDGNQKRPGID